MRRIGFFLASLTVSAALVIFTLRSADLTRVWQILREADFSWLLVAAVLYLASYAMRAARLRLLAQRARFAPLFGVVAMQTALIRTLPFRAGELAFPLLARRYGGESVARSVIVLVHVRLLDLLVLVAAVAIFAFALQLQGSSGASWVGIAEIAVAVAAAAGLFLLGRLARWTSQLLTRFGIATSLADRLQAAGREWDGLAPRQFVAALLVSVLALVLLLGCFCAAARACGVTLALPLLAAAASLSIAASLWPVSVGNVGVLETAFAAGLQFLGATSDRAVASGLLMQWGTLLLSVATAAIAWLLLRPAQGSEATR